MLKKKNHGIQIFQSEENLRQSDPDCWYAKAKSERFELLNGGVANIAYAKNRIWEKDLR